MALNYNLDFTCPFCNLPVKTDGYAVMHLQPACETFMEKDCYDYMVAVNDKIFGKETADQIRANIDKIKEVTKKPLSPEEIN